MMFQYSFQSSIDQLKVWYVLYLLIKLFSSANYKILYKEQPQTNGELKETVVEQDTLLSAFKMCPCYTEVTLRGLLNIDTSLLRIVYLDGSQRHHGSYIPYLANTHTPVMCTFCLSLWCPYQGGLTVERLSLFSSLFVVHVFSKHDHR